jgi:hypothetical protein
LRHLGTPVWLGEFSEFVCFFYILPPYSMLLYNYLRQFCMYCTLDPGFAQLKSTLQSIQHGVWWFLKILKSTKFMLEHLYIFSFLQYFGILHFFYVFLVYLLIYFCYPPFPITKIIHYNFSIIKINRNSLVVKWYYILNLFLGNL